MRLSQLNRDILNIISDMLETQDFMLFIRISFKIYKELEYLLPSRKPYIFIVKMKEYPYYFSNKIYNELKSLGYHDSDTKLDEIYSHMVIKYGQSILSAYELSYNDIEYEYYNISESGYVEEFERRHRHSIPIMLCSVPWKFKNYIQYNEDPGWYDSAYKQIYLNTDRYITDIISKHQNILSKIDSNIRKKEIRSELYENLLLEIERIKDPNYIIDTHMYRYNQRLISLCGLSDCIDNPWHIKISPNNNPELICDIDYILVRKLRNDLVTSTINIIKNIQDRINLE